MFGVLLCLVGGCAWLLEEFYHGSDTANRGLDSIHSPDNQQRLYIFYGDLLALSAACIFGLNDILAEYLLKSTDDQTNSRVEYLGMLGLCGAIFSFGVQVPILEWHKLQQISAELSLGAHYPPEDVGAVMSSAVLGEIVLLLLFVVAVLCYFYMSAMTFISMYDSTILNLSLQTCPLWAVVLTMLEQSMTMQLDAKSGWVAIPPAVFFISFTMITLGMILYESHPSKRAEMRPCV
jgi:solute carrier family 35 protein F1/2